MPETGWVTIGTRLSIDLFQRVSEIAEREQNQLSAVVRRLLSDSLDREDAARGIVRRRPRKSTRRRA